MKKDIVKYVERCLTCLQVKAKHQKPYGKMQPLEVPLRKWEHITMDLITKRPKTAKGYDAIWVVVDRLTKSAHFIPIRESYSSERMADVYVSEIVSRHGVPISIVSDRDTRFTSRFWRKFQYEMGTKLLISTAYHHKLMGKARERFKLSSICCVHVLLILVAVGISICPWQSSLIIIVTIQELRGPRMKCFVAESVALLCWGEVGQRELEHKEVVEATNEKINQIRAHLKVAQDRQKSYADKRRRQIEF